VAGQARQEDRVAERMKLPRHLTETARAAGEAVLEDDRQLGPRAVPEQPPLAVRSDALGLLDLDRAEDLVGLREGQRRGDLRMTVARCAGRRVGCWALVTP
jgi:hypothetical protein